jgi:hypothetical protein
MCARGHKHRVSTARYAWSVHVVAITFLAASIDSEAPALASALGLTAYETRLLLAAGMPAVVRRSDEAAALDLAATLRGRGHGAVAFDESDAVASSRMIDMRRLRVGPSAVSLEDRAGETLPFDDVLALVAARHRHRTATSMSTSERKFSASRALISGGLVTTATVKSESQSSTDRTEHVLYLFRRSGATPWILRERGTHWSGLGRPLAPSSLENFKLAVGCLRESAPGAVYDDRLLSRKSSPERTETAGVAGARTVTTSSEGGVDLLAHVVALSIASGTPR